MRIHTNGLLALLLGVPLAAGTASASTELPADAVAGDAVLQAADPERAVAGEADQPDPTGGVTPLPSGWEARPADHIAGLDDLRKIVRPAQVAYDRLYEATTEIQEMRRERIDPDSPKGRSLRQRAEERVTKASNSVRLEQRFDSVWKAIRHADGRAVPDITGSVLQRLDEVQ